MKQTRRNRIPREFYGIKGRVLKETSGDKPGDVLHITKNLYGFLGLNTRTGKHSYYFGAMLRDAEHFEIMEIIKD